MAVQMELHKIIISEMQDQQIIMLREVDGERVFPIVIGSGEAYAIDRRLKGDRLDLPRDSSIPNQPAAPGNIVPKSSPTIPADPADAPREDPVEHGCAPTPSMTRSREPRTPPP